MQAFRMRMQHSGMKIQTTNRRKITSFSLPVDPIKDIVKFHLLRPNDAIVSEILINIGPGRLIGAKSSPEPKLPYCRLNPQEQTSVKHNHKYTYTKIFIFRKIYLKVQKGSHVFWVS